MVLWLTKKEGKKEKSRKKEGKKEKSRKSEAQVVSRWGEDVSQRLDSIDAQ